MQWQIYCMCYFDNVNVWQCQCMKNMFNFVCCFNNFCLFRFGDISCKCQFCLLLGISFCKSFIFGFFLETFSANVDWGVAVTQVPPHCSCGCSRPSPIIATQPAMQLNCTLYKYICIIHYTSPIIASQPAMHLNCTLYKFVLYKSHYSNTTRNALSEIHCIALHCTTIR